MLERGYTAGFAESIYNQILGFGSYGFPQSHSASFALLVYASSWLKCHAPAAFTAGLLNSWPMGFYAPAQLVNDARRHEVGFRSIDVQHSDWECTLEANEAGTPEVRLGLKMVAGLAEDQGRAHGH
jgi:error-prone DNA polymerase